MFVALVQDLRSQLAANAMLIGAVPVVMLVANHGDRSRRCCSSRSPLLVGTSRSHRRAPTRRCTIR